MSAPGPQNQLDEATIDLLIKQVTDGLAPAEQRELDVLDSALASSNLQKFERAAAAVAPAGSARAEPLPAALQSQIEQQAQSFFERSNPRAATNVVDLGTASPAPRAPSTSGAYGWLAAAACLVLALFAWNRTPPPAPVAMTPAAPVVAPPVEKPPAPTAAEERAALLAKSDALKITFGATKDPAAAGVSGDVVWDPATQRGFLRFVGLAANDPAVRQYQLWIFDGGRDKRYPVDGGVFNIPADAGEVVIPIHAALPVLSAKAFAVTVEKPGGVVVSGREHVVVLGAAS
jgi:hypothetical protein